MKVALSVLILVKHAGLEMFHKNLDEGQAGDQLGALIRGMKRDEVRRGMVLCQPGAITSHSAIKTQVIKIRNIHTAPEHLY